jgi:hypothetical protein
MGFDANRVAKIREAIADPELRVTAVRDASDVRVFEVGGDRDQPLERSLGEIACERAFDPHPGWRGHIEAAPR